MDVSRLCRDARAASRPLALCDRARKDAALEAIVRGLAERQVEILAANALDLDQARAQGASAPMLDRLALDPKRMAALLQSVAQVVALADPVGATVAEERRPNGLRVRRWRVPIGVIAMVYEARPNVTIDAAALCLKAGNAVVLRGGSEAARTNEALVDVVAGAIEQAGLPRAAVQMLPPDSGAGGAAGDRMGGDHESIRQLVAQSETVDLVIPRGGEGLIRFVREHARVPVIAHAKGVCHLFVDRGAPVDMAVRLAVDGKLRRPGVCNALEALLVDAADAERLLPPIAKALVDGGCELCGCERTRALVPSARPAQPDDWGREFLGPTLAVRVVDGLDAALEHVARFGSGHTEAICTRDPARAERWRREVDAACVMVNASTRLHDGGELGLGAEIGIATSKLHWRGAMGLEALTTVRWVVDGDGQTRG